MPTDKRLGQQSVLCAVFFFFKWNIMQPVGQSLQGLFLYCPQAKKGLNVV